MTIRTTSSISSGTVRGISGTESAGSPTIPTAPPATGYDAASGFESPSTRPPVVLAPTPIIPDAAARFTGTVLAYDAESGKGMIRPANGEPDVFVHYSGIDMMGYKYLEVGAQVGYGIRPGVGGKPEAFEVRAL